MPTQRVEREIVLRDSGMMRAPDGFASGLPQARAKATAPRRRIATPPWLAQSVLARLPVGIAVIDSAVRLLYWNEQAASVFGIPTLLAAEKPALADMLGIIPSLTQPQRDNILGLTATAIAAGDGAVPDSCLRLSIGRDRRLAIQVHGLGSERWMLIIDDGALTAAARAMPNASDTWLDSLTGLHNRRQFNQVLRDRLAGAVGTTKATVVLIDLDRFATVNDRFGRPVGDALLCLVAQRLRRETRDDDLLVRLGGDEFAIVTPDGTGAEMLAKRLIATLSKPFVVEGHRISIGASIGIARYPDHGASTDQLMGHAACARDAAKDGGGGTWRVFQAAPPDGYALAS